MMSSDPIPPLKVMFGTILAQVLLQIHVVATPTAFLNVMASTLRALNSVWRCPLTRGNKLSHLQLAYKSLDNL